MYRNSQPFAVMLKGSMSTKKLLKSKQVEGDMFRHHHHSVHPPPPRPPLCCWREGSQFLEGGCWESGGEDSNNGVNNNMLTLVNGSRGLLKKVKEFKGDRVPRNRG